MCCKTLFWTQNKPGKTVNREIQSPFPALLPNRPGHDAEQGQREQSPTKSLLHCGLVQDAPLTSVTSAHVG